MHLMKAAAATMLQNDAKILAKDASDLDVEQDDPPFPAICCNNAYFFLFVSTSLHRKFRGRLGCAPK